MKLSTYLTQINGVSIYPIISLLIFVIFFVLVSIWVYRTSDQEISKNERLPLD